MAGGRLSDDDEPITSINVTPLVDIVLVLLIIFMVTTEVIHENDRPKAMPIELPAAASAQDLLSKGLLNVVVLASGDLQVNGAPSSFALLDRDVAAIKARGQKPQALISADKHVEYGHVAELMDFFRTRGVAELAFHAVKKDIQ